jgi:hypothetical protein
MRDRPSEERMASKAGRPCRSFPRAIVTIGMTAESRRDALPW